MKYQDAAEPAGFEKFRNRKGTQPSKKLDKVKHRQGKDDKRNIKFEDTDE